MQLLVSASAGLVSSLRPVPGARAEFFHLKMADWAQHQDRTVFPFMKTMLTMLYNVKNYHFETQQLSPEICPVYIAV